MESVPEDDLGIPVEWRSIECVDAIAIRLDQSYPLSEEGYVPQSQPGSA